MNAGLLEELLDGERIVLVDVGARGGIDPRWRTFERHLRVIGFEPDAAECGRLNEQAGSLPYPARFLPYALGRDDRDGVPFNVCNWEVASSIYEPNSELLADFPHAAPMLAVKERRTISTARLDTVAAAESLDPDLLKIDVEGAELDVLSGAEATLAEALVIDVEVEFQPIFRNQPLFGDVDSHLRERGWRLLGLRRNSWRRVGEGFALQPGYGGQLVSADALYYRHRGLLEGLSTRHALKLAVILAAYRQLDFALSIVRGPDLGELTPADRVELAQALAPDPGPLRRIIARLLARVGGERRRAAADALQLGEATTWRDPHHF